MQITEEKTVSANDRGNKDKQIIIREFIEILVALGYIVWLVFQAFYNL